jgi:hypothetical protein
VGGALRFGIVLGTHGLPPVIWPVSRGRIEAGEQKNSGENPDERASRSRKVSSHISSKSSLVYVGLHLFPPHLEE